MPSEAQARIAINQLLEAAGGRFLPAFEAKIQRTLARVWGAAPGA